MNEHIHLLYRKLGWRRVVWVALLVACILVCLALLPILRWGSSASLAALWLTTASASRLYSTAIDVIEDRPSMLNRTLPQIYSESKQRKLMTPLERKLAVLDIGLGAIYIYFSIRAG